MADMQINSQADIPNQLVQDLIKERRRDRLWRNLRFFAGFMLVVIFLSMSFCGEKSSVTSFADDKGGYVSYIHLEGMIAPGQDFSAEKVLPVLLSAFTDESAKGVVIDINSGGGTPVQASIIHDEILRLKKKYNKKVVVVGEDLLASGAYFVAVSADKIYVNPNTIAGSIGVIMQGFGFNDGIKKLGIERRVITAGDNKDRLDPFMPEKPEDVAKIKTVIGQVHDNFIQAVTQGRKGKLHGDTKELFSGDFWTGTTAVQLGLVDGLGNLPDVLAKEFGVSRFKDYTNSNNLLKRFASQLGSTLDLPLSHSEQHLLAKL
jgi:protease-4